MVVDLSEVEREICGEVNQEVAEPSVSVADRSRIRAAQAVVLDARKTRGDVRHRSIDRGDDRIARNVAGGELGGTIANETSPPELRSDD